MEGHLLADIGRAIIAAAAVGLPSYFIGIPLILSYLIAGVIIGPHLGFGLIQNSESITNLSEIGLVLLMFILGLEINLKKLLQAGRAVTISGAVQIIGCLIIGYLFFSMLGYNQRTYEVVYLSVACALSSTLIVVKILSDQMDLDSLPSRLTLGILVLQDFVAIGFLALQPNLSDLNINALLTSLSKVAILILISWVLARYVLPRLFKKAGRQPELMLILAMAWCFSMCGIANYLNLSLEMGALVAGISIASFPYHLDVVAKISSLRDFFITLFFVGLGLQIPMPTVEVLKLTALIVIFVLTSRVITIYPTLHKLGYANRSSLLPALNLSQISEFAIVLASLGVSYKHIGPDLLSAFIIALVITALISSFVLPAAHTIYNKLNPLLEQIGFSDSVFDNIKNKESVEPKIQASTVLLGFYREASSLLFEMQNRYSKDFIDEILVVDFNPESHQELKKLGINCLYGDISNVDTLRHLNLHDAKIIICSIPDKILKGTTNLKILKQLKQLAPHSCIIVTAENMAAAKEMYAESATYVFIPRIIGANNLVDVIEQIQTKGAKLIREDAIEQIKNRVEVIP
jgi:Kef-type K+ transport system membrane component KefB